MFKYSLSTFFIISIFVNSAMAAVEVDVASTTNTVTVTEPDDLNLYATTNDLNDLEALVANNTTNMNLNRIGYQGGDIAVSNHFDGVTGGLADQISTNDLEIFALDIRVTTNETDITTIGDGLIALEGEHIALEARVSTNEANIATNASAISDLITDYQNGDDAVSNFFVNVTDELADDIAVNSNAIDVLVIDSVAAAHTI